MENLAGRCPAAQRPPSADNPQPADGDGFEALGVRPVGCTGVAVLPPSPWEVRSAVALSPADRLSSDQSARSTTARKPLQWMPYPPFGADTGWIPIKMKATQIRLICMPW